LDYAAGRGNPPQTVNGIVAHGNRDVWLIVLMVNWSDPPPQLLDWSGPVWLTSLISSNPFFHSPLGQKSFFTNYFQSFWPELNQKKVSIFSARLSAKSIFPPPRVAFKKNKKKRFFCFF
jgi:hypothetical protein